MAETTAVPTGVLRVADTGPQALAVLLERYGLRLTVHPDGVPIPGSYWGAPEAGVIGTCVHVRGDTPVHSVLHESSHVVCMTPERRAELHTDAGGDDLEESAVCLLQVLLADELDGVGAARLMNDMDTWGYSFRLGSTQAWFERDAADARQWLAAHGLTDAAGRPAFRLRNESKPI